MGKGKWGSEQGGVEGGKTVVPMYCMKDRNKKLPEQLKNKTTKSQTSNKISSC